MRDRYDIALGRNPTSYAWPACDFDFSGGCSPRDVDCLKECPRVKEARIDELMSTEDGRLRLAKSMVSPVKRDIDYIGDLQVPLGTTPKDVAQWKLPYTRIKDDIQFFDVSWVKNPPDPSCRVISMEESNPDPVDYANPIGPRFPGIYV